MTYTYDQLTKMIDHSLLHPTMTDQILQEGCQLAGRYKVASACVKPYFVKQAAELLKGSGVAVGTVIGFPHGGNLTEVKRYETELACQDGATEIDMVVNVGKVLSKDWDFVEKDIQAVVDEAHKFGAIVKVIFENDFLPSDAYKTKLCQLCEKTGAEFVKTSTGYGFVKGEDGNYSYAGATEADLVLMRANCSEKVQVKAAGGVRDLDGLIKVRELGGSRCGATATVTIMEEFKRRESSGESQHSSTGSTLGTGGY